MAAQYLPSKWMDDAILSQVTSLGVSPDSLVSNLARSGQLGTGIRLTKLDGATPAVFNPVVAVVLQVPSMWNRWPKLQEMLKAVVETHAKSITGIDFGYTLETADTPVGHDSQTMKVPTKTTRSGVNPSMTFTEYPGMPIYNLFRTWQFDIQHPDTNMSILPSQIANEAEIPAWYMTAYAMTMLFIQYDPSGLPSRIYDAAIITNMFPTEIGEIGFQRQLGTTELKERSINFAGIVQHNENTRELGYRVAEMLALHKINYNFALPGVAGTTNVQNAIDQALLSMGGLSYEAIGTKENQNLGAIRQFNFEGTNGDTAYDDIWNGPNSTINIPKNTGAAASSVEPTPQTSTQRNDSQSIYGNTTVYEKHTASGVRG